MSKEFVKASDVLLKVFDAIEKNDLEQANKVVSCWREIIGDKIYSHSRIIDIDKNLLIIDVDHSGWSQQILFKKGSILRQINKAFPELEIKNLALRVKSECKTEYTKEFIEVGEGVPRVNENIEIKINEQYDDDLKKSLESLINTVKEKKYYD